MNFSLVGDVFGRRTSCGHWGDPCVHDVDARRLRGAPTAIRQGESSSIDVFIVVRPDPFASQVSILILQCLRAGVLMQGQDGWPDPETCLVGASQCQLALRCSWRFKRDGKCRR